MTYIANVNAALMGAAMTLLVAAPCFNAVCSVPGRFHGRVHQSRGLRLFKHTITGRPAQDVLCIPRLAPTISGTTV